MSRGFMLAALLAFVAPVLGAVVFLTGSDTTAQAARTAGPARVVLPLEQRKLSGTTSQKRGFGIKLSPDGRRIVLLSVSYEVSCLHNSMKMALDDKLYTPIAIAPDGHFTVTNHGQRISITGRIAKGKAAGTFSIKMVYGGLLACTTKPIHFAARV